MLRCTKAARIRQSAALIRTLPSISLPHFHTAQQQHHRTFKSTASPRAGEPYNPATVERAEDEVDVCIVGGGPAGLSAAIRIKQLEKEKGREIRVVVLEKGSEIGMLSLARYLPQLMRNRRTYRFRRRSRAPCTLRASP